jgi:two-component system response regulator DegU
VANVSQRTRVSGRGGTSLQDQIWALGTLFDRRVNQDREKVAALPYGRAGLKQATMEARVALEEVAVGAAEAAYQALTVAEVLDSALAALEQAEGQTEAVPLVHEATIATETLSPREREVLALVAEGRSNKAIAETLFVSPNTIKTHVASLLNKLHAETRVQLAAMAVRTATR